MYSNSTWLWTRPMARPLPDTNAEEGPLICSRLNREVVSMILPNIAQDGLFLVVVLLLVKPLGGYMMRVFTGQKTFLDPVFVPVERTIYRLTGIDANRQMDTKHYTLAFVLFSLVGTLLLYAILRLQAFLPWYDPVHLTTPMTPDLAMNTAISFSTTTTWQAYTGETTMSYFSQILRLTVHHFLAGAGCPGLRIPVFPRVPP